MGKWRKVDRGMVGETESDVLKREMWKTESGMWEREMYVGEK